MKLTDEEKDVLKRTADLFNAIYALEDHHESDMEEYTRAFHDIQNRIMARLARRSEPDFFN